MNPDAHSPPTPIECFNTQAEPFHHKLVQAGMTQSMSRVWLTALTGTTSRKKGLIK